MGGAGAVVGAMLSLARRKAKANVVGVCALAENMPDGNAQRPGDVLRINNGTTVEVLNTDAEGRLVLADGLSLAAASEPDAILDLATLTGACMVALGPRIAGLMGNNDALLEQVRLAADRAGEKVWPLPLPLEYRKDLESEIADLKNIAGGRYGGALHAGLFLQEFVDGRPWAHLDIAGPARFESEDAYVPKGGSGFGVRTILETVLGFRKPR
jgi:leucyl aminopeptidase